jgi:hypothetical protein
VRCVGLTRFNPLKVECIPLNFVLAAGASQTVVPQGDAGDEGLGATRTRQPFGSSLLGTARPPRV